MTCFRSHAEVFTSCQADVTDQRLHHTEGLSPTPGLPSETGSAPSPCTAGRRAAASVLEEPSGHMALCRNHNPVRNRTIKLHICRTISSDGLSCNHRITNCNIILLCTQPLHFQYSPGIIDSIVHIINCSPGSGFVHCYVPLVPAAASTCSQACQANVKQSSCAKTP